jgi:hypothetical protein
MRYSRLVFVAGVACLVSRAPHLSAQPSSDKPSIVVSGVSTDAMVIFKGMPYSATKTVARTTLTGTTSVWVSHVFRDAEGRERVDTADQNADGTPPTPDGTHTICVSDPVTKMSYTWTTGKNLEKYVIVSPSYISKHIIEVWPETSLKDKLAAIPDQPKREVIPEATGSGEVLPPTYLHGIYVTGKRIRIVLPPSAQNNAQQERITTETWTSPDLQLTVLRIQNDSTKGTSRTELTGIHREVPDPALFEPPADYARVINSPAPDSKISTGP